MANITVNITLLEALARSLEHACRFNPGDMVAPAAVLWADPEEQWLVLVPSLRSLMPELYTLGEYNPEKRTGPAIWLRCVIESRSQRLRPQQDMEFSSEKKSRSETLRPRKEQYYDKIPILYMPGVSRQTLRAGEECPDLLKPLVELQFRGTVWTQRNGRDWSVEAFLVSEEGLGLDLARDQKTHIAMLGALEQLAVTPVSRLLGKKLEAEDFDKLMIYDTARDLLSWMNQPREFFEKTEQNKWAAFCSRCKTDYGFDPEKDGELAAAEKLGLQADDGWKGVWLRFKEAPALYPNIALLLRRAKPVGEILFDKEPWPDENENEEKALQRALLGLADMNQVKARHLLQQLDEQHGIRRKWVWAQLGHSALAIALQHLQSLASNTVTAIGGANAEEMAGTYCDRGYRADLAAWQAFSSVSSIDDKKAITAAIRSVYLPWLEKSTEHFQKRTGEIEFSPAESVSDSGKVCRLFVDGLRFDLAQLLQKLLASQPASVTLGRRWAALPTMTCTAKPAVSPIAALLFGEYTGEDFCPKIAGSNQFCTADRFRKLLRENGIQVLGNDETGDPMAEKAVAWTEWGKFDQLGHDLGAELAHHMENQLALLIERINELLNAGWEEIRLVTDHGWLLMPGGLPKVDLPKYLVTTRGTRCASIKDTLHFETPTAAWHWNHNQKFAFAPGVHCFEKGHEFAHGGISLQECVIPELYVKSLQSKNPAVVNFKSVQWIGMRCRISLDTNDKVTADLRTRPNDAGSSISQPKENDEGNIALLVADDSLEGTAVSLVILDASGQVLAKHLTTVGGIE
jgi:hypothetical protein